MEQVFPDKEGCIQVKSNRYKVERGGGGEEVTDRACG